MAVIEIEINEDTRIAEIILNRPEKRNAINEELREALLSSIAEMSSNEAINCVVLRGNGPSFCAGYDFAGTTAPPQIIDDWRLLREHTERWLAIRSCRIPIVAAVHGPCLGVATLIATLVDFVVIAEDAVWGNGRIRAGAGYLGPALRATIGDRKAREIEFCWRQFTGRDAVEMGWANYAVPAADVLSRARALAADVAETPRDLLELMKASMNLAENLQQQNEILKATVLWDSFAHFTPTGRSIMTPVSPSGA
jgi:enoyl-CoA hydratase